MDNGHGAGAGPARPRGNHLGKNRARALPPGDAPAQSGAMEPLGFYEFFAGGGMARAGLGHGWRCLFANDVDPRKVASYTANWGGAEMRPGDVAGVRPDELPGIADLAWASFPCQDLSLAGTGAGLGGGRSGAFWPFWNLVSQLGAQGRKPRAIVIENVCGLLTSRGGADFAVLCETVGAAGYRLGAMVADARDFLPQSRPRLFLIALDPACDAPGGGVAPCAADHWHPPRLRAAQAALPASVRERWLWFAPPPPPARNLALADIVEHDPPDVRWHDRAETRRLLGLMSPVNRAKVDLVRANAGFAVGALYRRTRRENGAAAQRAEVRFDLAGCLRTPGGGSSRQTLLVIRDGCLRTRLVSARETARLMGLPEDYVLPARYHDAYHLTGDGVAVPVVAWIARWIIEPALGASAPARGRA